MRFSILSYNIHKSRHFFLRKPVAHNIATQIQNWAKTPDLITLQEVQHSHQHQAHTLKPQTAHLNQSKFYAEHWELRVYYEANAHYGSGHHGNATFSAHPVRFTQNFSISENRLEKRGLFYSEVDLGASQNLHLFNTHLNLRSADRLRQVQKIINIIETLKIPSKAPLIIAGDFNDWLLELSLPLLKQLQLEDSSQFRIVQSAHEYATFPAIKPQVNIDRFYFKNLQLCSMQVGPHKPFGWLSDHLPILAEFEF